VSISQNSFIEAEPDTSTLGPIDSTVIETHQDSGDDTIKMDDEGAGCSALVAEDECDPYFMRAANLNYLELLQPRNTLPDVGPEVLQWLEKKDRAAIQKLESFLPVNTDHLIMPNPDKSRAVAQ
jgi:hypothetical protein